MRKERDKGIYLKNSEFKVYRNEARGFDFWDPDFQVVFRSAGECERFFPQATRPEGKNGGVLFSLNIGGKERISRSRHIKKNDISQAGYERFVKAFLDLRKIVGDNPERKKSYDLIRLPDPELEPERYRMYGPFWNKRLSILWGYASRDKQGKLRDGLKINDALDSLRNYIDPLYRSKIVLGFIFRFALVALIGWCLNIGIKYGSQKYTDYRKEQDAIPRCIMCNEKLRNDLCPNLCFNCGIHKNTGHLARPNAKSNSMKCSFCERLMDINRSGVISVSPAGIAKLNDYVIVNAKAPGTFISTDWPDMKAQAGQQVYYRWEREGNYKITWIPDVETPEIQTTTIPVFVRNKKNESYSPKASASFVFKRSFSDTGNFESVAIVNTSFDDRPMHSFKTSVKWNEFEEYLPLDDMTGNKTARQLNAADENDKRTVTLRITDINNVTYEYSRELDISVKSTYPIHDEDVAVVNPLEAIVGEPITCHSSGILSWDADSMEIDWGDGNKHSVSKPFQFLSHPYTEPGKYTITLKTSGVQNKVLRKEVQIKHLKDIGPRLLDLSPPNIQIGSEVIARDVSAIEEVVRREIRWSYSKPFDKMSRIFAGQSFGSPGVHEVTLRLWKPDGTYIEETRNIKVVNDDWQVVLSIEPNPVVEGSEITINDESVVPPGCEVVARHLRWFPSLEYNPMESKCMKLKAGEPGFRKVVIRLLDANGEFHYGQASVTITGLNVGSELKQKLQ